MSQRTQQLKAERINICAPVQRLMLHLTFLRSTRGAYGGSVMHWHR
jgi:hypothetical protein